MLNIVNSKTCDVECSVNLSKVGVRVRNVYASEGRLTVHIQTAFGRRAPVDQANAWSGSVLLYCGSLPTAAAARDLPCAIHALPGSRQSCI